LAQAISTPALWRSRLALNRVQQLALKGRAVHNLRHGISI